LSALSRDRPVENSKALSRLFSLSSPTMPERSSAVSACLSRVSLRPTSTLLMLPEVSTRMATWGLTSSLFFRITLGWSRR